jgi:endonuclease/exonuclease/phosphatase family metal-dependent hydrolase
LQKVNKGKMFFVKTVLLCVFSIASQAISAGFTFPNGNDRSTIRVISYNVQKFEGKSLAEAQGCPRFESNEAILDRVRKQVPLRIAMELEIYRPDIITMQEATGEDKVKQIANYLGMNYVYFPGNGKWAGAVITKYKILESQQNPLIDGNCPKELFTRHWARVVLQIDNNKIVVHTAHLHPVDEQIRIKEITEIIKVIKKDIEAGFSVLLQGDLNHRDNDPEYQLWLDAGLTDAIIKKGIGEPFTVPSFCPQKRIDYICVSGPIEKHLAECRVLYEGAFTLHSDSLKSCVLSDHLPVLAIFQDTCK